MTTKNGIVQAIIFHVLTGKRKAAMDQLCHGLERFQVLEYIRKNPTIFEPILVYMEEQEPFISVFEIDESVVDEQKQNIYEYLSKADATTQRKILFFSTGSNVRPYLHKIVKIKAADSDAIFGSTCTNTITVPKSLKNKDEISSSFKCILENNSRQFKSFSSV